MKKIFLLMIPVILLTACSSRSNTEDRVVDYEESQYIEETTDDENEVSEDTSSIVCEKIKAIDFTIKESPLDITSEVDALYKEAYLNILKSEIPVRYDDGKKEYFRDLYAMGVEFEELIESPGYCSYYYNDLDGDGLPELGIRSTGYTYILKYDPEKNEFSPIFIGSTMYHTILGTGQIWYHNGLHVGYIMDRYIVLNDDKEWETVFNLEQGTEASPIYPYYCVSIDEYSLVDVSEENWNEITKPFFDATENAIPSRTLEEVFGELLEGE